MLIGEEKNRTIIENETLNCIECNIYLYVRIIQLKVLLPKTK